VVQQLVLVGAIVAVVDGMERPSLALLAVAPPALATALWVVTHVPPDAWTDGLFLALAPYAVFLGWAFVVAGRGGASRAPYQAATLAGIVFLVLARHCLVAGGWRDAVGLVAVLQGGAMLVLLRRVLAGTPDRRPDDGRVAMVAAGALGFVTAAIPLELSREWITVAWALETAALAWLYRRIAFRQILWWTGGLALAVFVRLALNPAVFVYHPRAATPIWNWYLYTYLVSAAALFTAARFLRGADDRLVPGWPTLSQLLPPAGAVLLFLLLNIEIADFYAEGPALTFNFLSASLAQDLTYTLGWALFAIALLVVGIRGQSRGVRGAALALLVVTIVKCFLHDLWRLGGLYRVGSFVGLAMCLSLVAVLLQRFVFVGKEEAT